MQNFRALEILSSDPRASGGWGGAAKPSKQSLPPLRICGNATEMQYKFWKYSPWLSSDTVRSQNWLYFVLFFLGATI